MRVALDAAPLIGHQTGIAMFTRGLFEHMADSTGIDISAYALSGRGAKQLGSVVPPGIPRTRLPMPARPLLDIWARFDRPRVEAWTGDVDVVHGTNFVVPPSRGAEVVTVHDLTCVRYPEMCTAATLRYPRLIRRAIDRGAMVHVPTRAIAAEVKEHFAIDAHVVAPGVPGVVDTGSRSTGDPYVLAIGTIEPRKDLALLVRAFDMLAAERTDLRLVVAGALGWDPAEVFARQLHSARHRNRIDVLDRVDDPTRGELLRNARALVYPSIYEGFGLPPLEAMSVGTPVVVTSNPAVDEVVGDAAVIVRQRDAHVLADSIGHVLDDESSRSELVEKGKQRIRQFSWQRTADEMTALYRCAVEAK